MNTGEAKKNTAIALGTFDGLHRGHRAVITSAVSFAEKGLLPFVLLFDEHPQSALTGEAPIQLLSLSLKTAAIEKMGASIEIISFKEVRNMEPRDFIKEVLIKRLGAKALVCGENYRFGRNGAGDTATLAKLCEEFGLTLSIAQTVFYDGEAISSTRIRTAVENGDMRLAREMLGSPFAYDFEVVAGKKVGRTLGIPTINQLFPEGFAIPREGVYISETRFSGEKYRSVTNIGRGPTFGKNILRSETTIMGFTGDLYGQKVTVGLLEYLRPEKAFSTADLLRSQIARDIETARQYKAE